MIPAHQTTTAAAALTNGHAVPDGTHDGKDENGTQVIKEETVGHEIASIQDNGRKHVQEEDIGGERRHGGRVGVEEQEADEDAENDKHAGFRENVRQFGRHVESCGRKKTGMVKVMFSRFLF